MRLFVNRPNLSFQDVNKGETTVLDIDGKDLCGAEQRLPTARFVAVSDLVLFFEKNQGSRGIVCSKATHQCCVFDSGVIFWMQR